MHASSLFPFSLLSSSSSPSSTSSRKLSKLKSRYSKSTSNVSWPSTEEIMGQQQARIDPSYRHTTHTHTPHHASLPPTPSFPEPPYSAPPVLDDRLSRSLSSKPKNLARKLSQKKSPVKSRMRAFEDMVAAAEAAAGEIRSEPAIIPIPVASEQIPPSPRITPTRPAMHRRTSSASKSSIKSSRRAEREWRAKVAALSHAAHGATKGTVRGPVPPKRTPPSRPPLDSPSSDVLLTPPQTAPIIMVQDSEKKVAKSLSSGKSFATLGHHLGPTLHNRKASVPRSVTSSFYFDHTVSRVSSRPPSAGAEQFLSPEAAANGSRAATPAPVAQVVKIQPKVELPPFDISSLDVDSSRPDTASESEASTAQLPSPLKVGLPEPTEQPLKEESPKKPLKASPGPLSMQTPSRHHAKKLSTPGTPVSPMTSFLLTAPIEKISLTSPQATPERKGHPFAWRESVDIAPTPPSKLKAKSLDPTRARGDIQKSLSEITGMVQIEGKVSTVKKEDPFVAPKSEKGHDSRILQPRRTQERERPKVALIGTGHDYARSELERQREKLRRMGVDLTPGMETGERPPKSGLPMADLQKWLAQSAIV